MDLDVQPTPEHLVEVLKRATSQNAEVLRSAEAKLLEWETQQGFYNALLNIISIQDIDVNVRWIAVLYLKNGIDRYWRKNAPNAINEEEKNFIKRMLTSNFNEPINQIATQKAILISKIARIDCPKDWNELVPTLLENVLSSDRVSQHQSLLTLHHVVKAISSKRLSGDRKVFFDFAANIYSFIYNLWNTFSDLFMNDICHNESIQVALTNMENAVFCLKILRKLSMFGFRKPYDNSNCLLFLEAIFPKMKGALECRKQLKEKGGNILDMCEKYINHSTKVLTSLLETFPLGFVHIIQQSLDFTMHYLFTPEGVHFLYERFTIQCFNIIKGILLCTEFKIGRGASSAKYPETLRANDVKKHFFQPSILVEICRKLVTHYFLLTKEELDTWHSDPETFVNDEIGDSWKYSIRPSMETVFVTIFHEFRDILAPVLLDLIRDTSSLVRPEDLRGILKKDAVYNAVTLSAFDLYEEVDFDQWFTTTLMEELNVKHRNYIILKRRIAALVGRWTGIKLSSQLRPAMYRCIINLLGPEEDLVVRLTASSTLRYAIDDFEFNAEQFKEFLEPAFNLTFGLLKQVTECETKMHVLNVLTLMVERVGHTIHPHWESLIQYLPLLWKESDDHNMLRCAIVSTLVQLVRASGMVVPELGPFLLPIIALGTDTEGSAIVYLLEDSLELWIAVLENSSSITNEMIQLFNNIPKLLDYSTEVLAMCLQICKMYLLLAPEMVLRSHGVQVITICDSLMSDLKNEGILLIGKLLDTFIRVCPGLGAETVLPILPRILKEIYDAEKYPMLMSLYLSLISRILLSSHDVFLQALSMLARALNLNEEQTLSKILDVWLTKMVNVVQAEQRKLMGLALTYLLTTQSRSIIQRFPTMMIQILEALNDITRLDENGVSHDSLVISDISDEKTDSYFREEGETCCDTIHDERKKQLVLIDPVHTIVLRDYLQSQIFVLKNQLGQANYEQLLQLVDADTMSQLREYIDF